MIRAERAESLQGLELLEWDPKAGSRGGIQAVLERLQQREHGTLGTSEGVKQEPPSWIQPCRVKPSQAGPGNCSWLWHGKGQPQCISKAAAPVGCVQSVWNSSCGMCWKHLEEPLAGLCAARGFKQPSPFGLSIHSFKGCADTGKIGSNTSCLGSPNEPGG